MNRPLHRLVPSGFAGQVAAIVMVALLLSQALAAILYAGLLPRWQHSMRPDAALGRIEVIVKALDALPPDQRATMAARLTTPDFMLGLVQHPTGTAAPHVDTDLESALAARLGLSRDAIHVSSSPGDRDGSLRDIEIELPRGGALRIATRIGLEHRLGLVEEIALGAFGVFVLVGLGAWLAWYVNAPLSRFARAAERVGVDVNAPPFLEAGPTELRRLIRSFNQMQERLQRLLTDRTRMLAAISHDLRTPLTRIRLRLETGRAAAESDRIVTDIETMEAMLSSTLAFVRGVEESEQTEIVDLDLLLQTVTDLITDIGGVVHYESPGRSRYACRPQSLMRAFTNVTTNAAKYGGCARVRLEPGRDGTFAITVADDGPGIPAEERERVFEPFYRTASARERDSEGMGLGLSIARSIVLAHGGTIELLDGATCGLIVRIVLPAPSSALTATDRPS